MEPLTVQQPNDRVLTHINELGRFQASMDRGVHCIGRHIDISPIVRREITGQVHSFQSSDSLRGKGACSTADYFCLLMGLWDRRPLCKA